jgi:hypothetical protein
VCVLYYYADNRQKSNCFETVAFPFLEKKKKSHLFAFNKKNQSTKRHKSMESSSATAAATAYNTLGARTRAQKRRMGERDVWDLIVNNDDICFKHILPRLNKTDLKFLYGVNTETRKLIKRSSRTWDLKWGFEVKEMSSISTLEFAWENRSSWSRYWTDEEKSFCHRVAFTNKLELLKWAREEKKCEWDMIRLLRPHVKVI